jgi:hypothetical protein
MQADAPTAEQLKAQLAAVGLELDNARLEVLLPVYAGVLSGTRRLAALDLGETEPAMIFRRPRRSEVGS